MLKADFKKEVERGLTGGDGSVGDCLLQTVPEPYVGHRESKSKPRRGCWKAIAPEATVWKWPARTFWPEPTWTAGIQRRCFSRRPDSSGCYQRTESRRSSTTSAKKHRENYIRTKAPRLRLHPIAYDNLRQQVLRRDGWHCQSCGAMSHLEVHHGEFRRHSGHDAELNLITLRTSCHSQTHWPDLH